jgi:hypothetical protein
MTETSAESEHPKKRRRRDSYHEQPLLTRLEVDDHLSDRLCVVTRDLWTKLNVGETESRGWFSKTCELEVVSESCLIQMFKITIKRDWHSPFSSP